MTIVLSQWLLNYSPKFPLVTNGEKWSTVNRIRYFHWFLWSIMACCCSRGETSSVQHSWKVSSLQVSNQEQKCCSFQRKTKQTADISIYFSLLVHILPLPHLNFTLTSVWTKACVHFQPIKTTRRKHLYC